MPNTADRAEPLDAAYTAQGDTAYQEPVADWQVPDISPDIMPAGLLPPVADLPVSGRRGRRRDPLEIVAALSPGNGVQVSTYYLATNASSQLAAGGQVIEPFPIVARSGSCLWRRVWLIGSQASPLLGVLVAPATQVGMANAALLTPGDIPLDLPDSELYASTAQIPNLVQASLSGYLVVVSYSFNPAPLAGD